MRHLIFVLFLVLVGCGSADGAESGDNSGDDSTGGETAEIPPEEGGCPEGGVVPVAGPDDGPPENCEVLFEGCCYAQGLDACAAAGCADDECVVAESYPGQISRCE